MLHAKIRTYKLEVTDVFMYLCQWPFKIKTAMKGIVMRVRV